MLFAAGLSSGSLRGLQRLFWKRGAIQLFKDKRAIIAIVDALSLPPFVVVIALAADFGDIFQQGNVARRDLLAAYQKVKKAARERLLAGGSASTNKNFIRRRDEK